jgi:hypothetical protein
MGERVKGALNQFDEWKNMTAFRGTHRHYKGGLYQRLFDATHSETEELLTIYLTEDGQPFARPKAMFDGFIDDGRRRFQPIGDSET